MQSLEFSMLSSHYAPLACHNIEKSKHYMYGIINLYPAKYAAPCWISWSLKLDKIFSVPILFAGILGQSGVSPNDMQSSCSAQSYWDSQSNCSILLFEWLLLVIFIIEFIQMVTPSMTEPIKLFNMAIQMVAFGHFRHWIHSDGHSINDGTWCNLLHHVFIPTKPIAFYMKNLSKHHSRSR